MYIARSIDNWNATKLELEPVNTQLAKYYANKIALRHNKLSELEEQKRVLCKKLIDCCPHDLVEVRYGTYTDVGYGLDRHYYHHDLFCTRCDRYLVCKTDGDSRSITEPMSLEDAVQAYIKRESLSDEDLSKLSMRRHTRTATTTSYTRI